MDMRDEGGSAFPVNTHMAIEPSPGMSLRDWMAGQALAGIAARECPDDSTKDSMHSYLRRCAYRAYGIANAMLAARLERGS